LILKKKYYTLSSKYEFEYPHDKHIKLSQEVKSIIADKAKYSDRSSREDIKAELKVDLILTLAENDYPPVHINEVFKVIFEETENF
jgi:type I restriction enzyme, R subunit